jgi:hypothetical protein
MQTDQIETLPTLRQELSALRGLWTGVDQDLNSLGIGGISDLRGRDAAELTRAYCDRVGRPFDPVLKACFAAIVQFAETGEARPWWHSLRAEARMVLHAGSRRALGEGSGPAALRSPGRR